MAFGRAPGLVSGLWFGAGRFGPGWVSLVPLALLLSADVLTAGVEQATERTIHIVAMGSLEGQFEACGCQPEPRGGLARRAGALAQLRQRNEPVLHLDLGNFCETRAEIRTFTNRFLWDSLVEMGLDAVTIGRRELQNWSLFDSLTRASGVPIVSTNVSLRNESGTEPIGHPTLVLEKNGVRFGFIGVLDPAAVSDLSSFQADDPAVTLQAHLPGLRTEADVLILLSQLSPSATCELLRDLPDIDVALVGQGEVADTTRTIGKTIVQIGGGRGQYFARIDFTLNRQEQITSLCSQSPPLDSSFPEDLSLAEKVRQARTVLKRLHTAERRREQIEFNTLFERWRSASR